MQNRDGGDRRRSVRVCVRGRVVMHGDGYGCGEIRDVSMAAIRFRFADPTARFGIDDTVELNVRFDGAAGEWSGMSGRVARVDAPEIVVVFHDLPADFEDRIQGQLLAMLESEHVMHVLLVDPVSQRRSLVAASLRAAGRRVSEAATPLDAIDQLGESRAHLGTVAIADTIPPSIADELRAYLRSAHADLGLLRLIPRTD